MKKLFLLFILLFVLLYSSFSQVTSSYTTKEYHNDKDDIHREYVVFTFTNTSSSYVNKEVTITYKASDGKYVYPYTKTFNINMKPNEVRSGSLNGRAIQKDTYYTSDDLLLVNKVLKGKTYYLKSFEVTFK